MNPSLEVRLHWDVCDTRVSRLDGVVLKVVSVRSVGLGIGICLRFRVDAARRTVIRDCARLRWLNERHIINLLNIKKN